MTISRLLAPLCFAFALSLASGVLTAGEPAAEATAPLDAAPSDAATAPVSEQQIATLLSQLDSENFAVREDAARRLGELASLPRYLAALAANLRRVSLDPATSFEVRTRIAPILEQLRAEPSSGKNALPAQQGEAPTPEEIDRLAAALTDDEYGVRVGAIARFDWLLRHRENVPQIYATLKRRMADPTLGESGRRDIAPVLERARGAWLLGPDDEAVLGPVSDEQMVAWIDLLAMPLAADRDDRRRAQRRQAEQEVLDLLARAAYVNKVAQALGERLAKPGLTDDALQRIENLLHWTKPALVAEFWFVDPSAGNTSTGELRHGGVQYLLVGVPSLGEGAERPSHFDRIDDREAHCVSGNALSEGNYPVGVLFPHPQQESAFFHLVNLPAPRRRMAYEHYLRTDEEQRARDLSRRTLEAIAARKSPLQPSEILMLGAVDREEFSRFVGPYFMAVDDTPFEIELAANTPAGQTSRHGLICLMLADRGTPTAIPGLLKAIEAKRILPPTPGGPCDMPWIAALAIASRVQERREWPDVDDWLASLVPRTEPLVLPRRNVKPEEINSEDDAPEIGEMYPDLGATAAAILLRRHGIAPSVYGLEPIGRQLLIHVGCQGHRFTQAHQREALLEWWGDRQTAPSATSAATASPRR
ncbi:MAG: hypothetical protein KF708_10375 [Pirellulales bacterium]|nr:hypothetical protein [Pirellulales bacterium]